MDEFEGATGPTVCDAGLDGWVREDLNLRHPLIDPVHLLVVAFWHFDRLRPQRYNDSECFLLGKRVERLEESVDVPLLPNDLRAERDVNHRLIGCCCFRQPFVELRVHVCQTILQHSEVTVIDRPRADKIWRQKDHLTKALERSSHDKPVLEIRILVQEPRIDHAKLRNDVVH